jgi:hypothetical protein
MHSTCGVVFVTCKNNPGIDMMLIWNKLIDFSLNPEPSATLENENEASHQGQRYAASLAGISGQTFGWPKIWRNISREKNMLQK